ncbi:MAG: ribbon-helix-helix domain-containing protein [Candidatus Sericytochromatia bacterium]
MPKKKQYPLRLDADVYAQLERWADDELRSVNSHIEYLLREALRRAGRLKPGPPSDPEGLAKKPQEDNDV